MSMSQTNCREIKEIRNPKVQLSEDDAAAFRRLREQRLVRIDKDHAILRAGRPTEDIGAFKNATAAVFGGEIPDFESRREQIVEEFKNLFDKHRPYVLPLTSNDLAIDYGDLAHPFVPIPLPEGIGELWWAQTAFFSSLEGLTVDSPDEFVHIFGHVHYDGDPLLTGSVGYIEDYVLSPDRFPSTTSTKFDIAVELRVIGILSGFTGLYHWLWAADDKWCKCWQIMRRTAFLSTGPVLDNRSVVMQMIDLANVHPVGQFNPQLNFRSADLLRFDAGLHALAASGTSILVQIETRFDIQLEGDADIWFRRFGGNAAESVPSSQNAVLLRSDPMVLQPR
jgi:hypothetical protein